MATKRSVSSEPLVTSGAASTRAKSAVTRKHRNATAEKSDNATLASPSQEATPVSNPSFDEIAQLAYFYWEARGYQGGSSEEDWLRAEYELRTGQTMTVAN